MADNEDLLAGMPEDEPLPKNVRSEPLTMQERFFAQNLFDTQPTRRQAYLKKLGFEMNPKNDNEYRPIGALDSGWAEIDPGVSAYFKKGGIKELGKDFTDVVWDFAENAVVAPVARAAGQLGGMGAGAMTANPAGILAGRVAGGIAGGAAAKAGSEILKKEAGDLLLDENIPLDKGAAAVQSLVTGTFAGIGPAAKVGWNKLKAAKAAMKAEAIKNVAKATGGEATAEVFEEAVKHPERFTREAVDGANERLLNVHKQLFGVDPDQALTMRSTRQINPESAFGKAVKPLNDRATAEINRLSTEAAANWKVSDIVGETNKHIMQLSQKFSRTQEEDAALKYLKGKVAELYSKVKKPAGGAITDAEINYGQGRQFLKSIQDDAFNREIPGSSFLKQIAGNLREIADKKAEALGSKLPEINAQRAKILSTFETARQKLTPQKLLTTYTGKNSPMKVDTEVALRQVDDVLGTQYGEMSRTGALQSVIENVYKTSAPAGSSRVLGAGIVGGATGLVGGAGAGAALGGMTGAGAIPGAILGAGVGAAAGARKAVMLANPEVAIKDLIEARASQMAAEAAQRAPMTLRSQVGATATGQALSRSLRGSAQPTSSLDLLEGMPDE